MKVMVDLPIPDGWDLAEEKQRVPVPGDWFMYQNGCVYVCGDNRLPDEPMWIVRKKWTWPRELKDGTLAFCSSKLWWYFTASDGTQLLNVERFLTTEMPQDKEKVYKSSEYK